MRRRLTAILSVDDVGASRFMDEDQNGRLASLKALHTDLMDPTIAAHGALLNLMGGVVLSETFRKVGFTKRGDGE